MDRSSENIHEETESFPENAIRPFSEVERIRFSSFLSPPEEPEILENRIDYEAVNLYRKYVNKLRTIRQRYLLRLILLLALCFIICLSLASTYLSSNYAGQGIARDLNRFFGFLLLKEIREEQNPVSIELFIVIGILLLSIFVIIGFIIDNFSLGSTLRRSNTRLKKLELAVENNREEL